MLFYCSLSPSHPSLSRTDGIHRSHCKFLSMCVDHFIIYFYLRSSTGFRCHCSMFWENWKLSVRRVSCSICRVSKYCRDLNRLATVRKSSCFKPLFCFTEYLHLSPNATLYFFVVVYVHTRGYSTLISLKARELFFLYVHGKQL